MIKPYQMLGEIKPDLMDALGVDVVNLGSTTTLFGFKKDGWKPWALRVITATAIGGASLYGGSGTIFGTTLGVLFLAMVYNAFNMTGVNTYWQDVAIGGMLIAAVFFDEYLKRRRVTR